MSDRPILTIVRGLPGAGKSTLARRICAESGATLVEPDALLVRGGEYRFDHDAWQAALRRASALVEHLACWRCDCVYADVLADPADVRVLWDRYSWGALGQAELLVVRLDIPEGLSVRNTRHAVPMSDVRRMAAAMGAYPGEEVMDWREVWR